VTATWEVGQRVHVYTNGYRQNELGSWSEATIEKIGRRWVTFRKADGWQDERFDKETGALDGGQYISRGTVYANKEARIVETATDKAWEDFRESFGRQYHRPSHLTLADIERLRAILTPTEGGA